jgi:hypothetical protein
LVGVWQERLGMFANWILEKSFRSIEGSDEKFPTVSRCLKVCRENKPYESEFSYDDKNRFTFTKDKDDIPCILDIENKCLLYRAEDCPEGREFLAKLKEVSQAVSLPRA